VGTLALEAASRRKGLAPKVLRSRLTLFGVTPLLIAVDVFAVVLTTSLVWADLALTGPLIAAFVAVNAAGGLYRSRLTLSILDDVPSLVGRGMVAGTVAFAIETLLGTGHAAPPALWGAGVCVVLAVAGRAIAYRVVRRVRSRRLIAHPTLVLGAGVVGGQVVRTLLDHPEYGLLPVGFVDSDPFLVPDAMPVPLLGGNDDLARVITTFGVREVIIAFGAERESAMIDVLRTCDRLKCEIFLVPRLFEMHSTHGQHGDEVWGMPLIRMRRAAYRSPSWRLKRAMDVVVASVGLALAAPLLAVIAVAVRLESRGGILFRQERVGLDGSSFTVLKFRTLAPSDAVESATLWSIASDHRLKGVGRLLRRTSLDELPQLWNVLVGDMSLVGPRPERPHFVAEFQRTHPHYFHRHRVPAGLTGWAQVHGLRGDTSIADRARFDNFYVENWSLWLDIKILLRTARAFLRGAA